jgi:hypothetical protein
VPQITTATSSTTTSSSKKKMMVSGATEVCVKTRNNGWILGRRANQSHREFFVLVDEKAGNLADIQEVGLNSLLILQFFKTDY